jgi:predicted nucleotidyltransferase
MAESVSAKQKWPRRGAKAEQVSVALERFADWVGSKFGLKLLILFGSYADGTFHMDSDVDLLVVADGMPGGWGKKRVFLEERGQIEFPAALQTFPYTPDEFLEMCRQGSGIAYSALTEGQVVYIDDEYRKKLISAL